MDDNFLQNYGTESWASTLTQKSDLALQHERQSSSVYSPGVVSDSETLARQIFTPIHLDPETNQPTPSAFDDAFTRGLSTNRIEMAGDQGIHDLGRTKAKTDNEKGRTQREYAGFFQASVGNIRALTEANGARLFAIYDTALEQVPSHCDVCCIAKFSKSEKKGFRRQLQEVFTQLDLIPAPKTNPD